MKLGVTQMKKDYKKVNIDDIEVGFEKRHLVIVKMRISLLFIFLFLESSR